MGLYGPKKYEILFVARLSAAIADELWKMKKKERMRQRNFFKAENFAAFTIIDVTLLDVQKPSSLPVTPRAILAKPIRGE